MKKSRSLSFVVRWLDARTLKTGHTIKYAGLFCLALSLFLSSLLFSSCSNPFGGGTSAKNTSSVTAQQGLNAIGWCAKPSMVFRDEGAVAATATPTAKATATHTSGTPGTGASTPSTITDWSVVKNNLGFTVYLPASLPHGSCLVSAQATIHDAIFGGGGNFTIGYLLPDHTSLSFSETPLKVQSTAFQCNPSTSATSTSSGTPTTTPTASTAANQLCSGARSATNIIMAGAGPVAHLQQIFDNLQTDVSWIPAS